VTGIEAYNTSRLNQRAILADPGQVAGNLRAWIAAFDADTRDVIEKFDFDAQIGRLDRAKLLYLVLSKVTEMDLHPDKVSNVEMGHLHEEEGGTPNDGGRNGRLGLRPNQRKAAVGRLFSAPSSGQGWTAGAAAPGPQASPGSPLKVSFIVLRLDCLGAPGSRSDHDQPTG
jgi:hypothetical protein